jgi:hypothetical protein
MPKNKILQPETDKQTIEKLTERYQALNVRKIQAQTNLDNAEKQLRELQKKARDTYETDDVEELKKKLEQLKAENESKRASYQQLLDRIEGDLSQVEAKHGSVDDLDELL